MSRPACFVALLALSTTLGFGTASAEIFVSNSVIPKVVVHSEDAQGNAAPVRTLEGPDTGSSFLPGVALDLVNGEIFLVDSCKIYVYPIEADGDPAPIRLIDTGDSAACDEPFVCASGIYVDPVHDELFAADRLCGKVGVFRRDANGLADPLRVIDGPNTGLKLPVGIHVDLDHDEVFVTDPVAQAVSVFPRTGVGDIQPTRKISGGSTLLSGNEWLFVSVEHNELYVSNHDSVAVFSRTAGGDLAPLRRIAGSSTMISNAAGIVLTDSDELIVAQEDSNSVLVFPRMGIGNVSPLRSITGGATELSGPVGIASRTPPVFTDGFESGDTSSWSSTVQ